MVGEKAEDARAQVAAMDRHVEASLARLDRSATWPIVWYRGPLFGLQSCAIYDMAIGSAVGHYQRGADGMTDQDRHEVAHCVITRDGHGPERPAEGPDRRVGAGQPGDACRRTGRHRLERPREGITIIEKQKCPYSKSEIRKDEHGRWEFC